MNAVSQMRIRMNKFAQCAARHAARRDYKNRVVPNINRQNAQFRRVYEMRRRKGCCDAGIVVERLEREIEGICERRNVRFLGDLPGRMSTRSAPTFISSARASARAAIASGTRRRTQSISGQ
jgi:hypothetical protein